MPVESGELNQSLLSDLLRIWNLPPFELPADYAFWGVCHLRLRNRRRRCAVLVPVAGERFSS